MWRGVHIAVKHVLCILRRWRGFQGKRDWATKWLPPGCATALSRVIMRVTKNVMQRRFTELVRFCDALDTRPMYASQRGGGRQ